MKNQTVLVDKNKIYVYRLPGRQAASGLVLYVDCDYSGFKGICFFTPAERSHMIKGKLGRKTAAGFTFIADQESYAAGEWEFIEVTYDNFKREYHKLVEGGEEILTQVGNTEELQEWYHRSFPILQN